MNNTVLIVDDSFLNRVMMKELLQKNLDDINFLEAENGQDAFTILNEKEVDLMILDLNMPIMDGYEVLKKIKADERMINLPIIVNSSVTDYENMAYAISLGARDFFTKTKASEEMGIILSTKVKNILEYSHKINDILYLNKLQQLDMDISSKIQKSFVKDIVENGDLDISVHYQPKDMLSGDIISSISTNSGKNYLLLVDMQASSISSVLMAVLFRELFMKKARHAESASKLMQDLNDDFIVLTEDLNQHILFSAFIAQFDENGLSVCNAGFSTIPFIFYSNNAGIEKIVSSGKMIGMNKGTKYSLVNYELSKGDAVVFYTNGLFQEDEPMDINKLQSYFEELYANITDKDKLDTKDITEQIRAHFVDENFIQDEDLTIATIKK